ncbi:MAG: hypothetical protein AAF401_06245 [Pseudomonadota bacterium]
MRIFLILVAVLWAVGAAAQDDRAKQALSNIGELIENSATLRAELAELETLKDAEAAALAPEERAATLAELTNALEDANRAITASQLDGGENLDELNRKKDELTAAIDALNQFSESAVEERAARVAEIKAELSQLDAQIGAVATGVSTQEYGADGEQAFDLNAEAQKLVEPFIAMLRDATENARQIERLRRDLSEAQRREALARRALDTLSPIESLASEETMVATLAETRGFWEARANAQSDLAAALQQQLDDRLSDRGDTRAAAGQAASSFVRERGLSLAYGFGAFVLVFGVMRLIHRAASWLRTSRRIRRSLATRLANLIFTAITPVFAVGAMLTVFNARNDWLLLGVFGVMLLALIWIGIKMIPEMIDQVVLLLNLGAVQEDERVIFDDTPYLVKRLDFYTDLENPALDGAEFTLPIKDLLGLHSRPSGHDEPWFPTARGDWVRLADETAGQVIGQTPDIVEIQIPGGAVVTYATGDFLAQTPQNLSEGYRSEVEFGVSYRHQTEAPDKLMEQLREHVRSGLLAIVPQDQLRDVAVELMEAGDNAIIYEVEADLVGAAAHRFEDVERELARLCVDACNKFGWEIPFPQMVVHRG